MKQFEIFCFHTRNFITKKQLFLFPFFFPHRKSANTDKRLNEPGERRQQWEGTFCQYQERICRCAEWSNEQQKDCCPQKDCFFFKGSSPRLFFCSYYEIQSRSSSFQMTDIASWPGLQGLVWMTLSTSHFGQGLTSSTSVAMKSIEHCFLPTGLTSLYFPKEGQGVAANVHFY